MHIGPSLRQISGDIQQVPGASVRSSNDALTREDADLTAPFVGIVLRRSTKPFDELPGRQIQQERCCRIGHCRPHRSRHLTRLDVLDQPVERDGTLDGALPGTKRALQRGLRPSLRPPRFRVRDPLQGVGAQTMRYRPAVPSIEIADLWKRTKLRSGHQQPENEVIVLRNGQSLVIAELVLRNYGASDDRLEITERRSSAVWIVGEHVFFG